MSIATILTVLTTLRQLRKREHWTREQVEAHQAHALGQLREYVYERSPFYQRFHRGLMDRPLHELPVLTKAMMMEHFDDLVTDRQIRLEDIRAHMKTLQGDQHYLDRYWVTATSGSTGQPGIFCSTALNGQLSLPRSHAVRNGVVSRWIYGIVGKWRWFLPPLPCICPSASA